MNTEDRRVTGRVIPRGSDEEMVSIEFAGGQYSSKLLDLSNGGALVYVLSDSHDTLTKGAACTLSLYFQGNVFAITATIARSSGRLLAFQFGSIAPETLKHLQAKLDRMEAERKRLQSLA